MRLDVLINNKTNIYRPKIAFMILGLFFLLNGCSHSEHKADKLTSKDAGDVIPFFEHWNLILGDGSNVGNASTLADSIFFYTTHDKDGDWVVFKATNAGISHGSSNNTRTEIAQLKKWSPLTENKLSATLKVMGVSNSGDARVAASYSVVVGQIHSADGHENELSLIHI